MSRPDTAPGVELDRDAADLPPGNSGGATATSDVAKTRGAAASDRDRLDARLRAVERELADGDPPAGGYADAAALSNEVEELAETLDELDARVDDLEAATRALRGYVGEIRSVNDEVEGQAATAIERVDRLGERVAALEERDAATGSPSAPSDATDGTGPRPRSGDRDGQAPDDRQPPGAHPTPDERDGDDAAPRRTAGPFAEALEHGVVPSGDAGGRGRRRRNGTEKRSDGREGLGATLLSRLRSWL